MHLYYAGPFKFTALSQNKVSYKLKTSVLNNLKYTVPIFDLSNLLKYASKYLNRKLNSWMSPKSHKQ